MDLKKLKEKELRDIDDQIEDLKNRRIATTTIFKNLEKLENSEKEQDEAINKTLSRSLNGNDEF